MKKIWFLTLALAGALSAQVAGQANAGYKTPEGRKQVAAGWPIRPATRP